MRRLGSDDISQRRHRGRVGGELVTGIDRSVDAREKGIVPADRVVDVQFRAFMEDPFTTIREIYERLGLELSDESEQRMRAFLADNTTEKHGGHHYTFADTELDMVSGANARAAIRSSSTCRRRASTDPAPTLPG